MAWVRVLVPGPAALSPETVCETFGKLTATQTGMSFQMPATSVLRCSDAPRDKGDSTNCGSLYEGSFCFGPRLGAPDFWKLPFELESISCDSRAILRCIQDSISSDYILGLLQLQSLRRIHVLKDLVQGGQVHPLHGEGPQAAH